MCHRTGIEKSPMVPKLDGLTESCVPGLPDWLPGCADDRLFEHFVHESSIDTS